MHYLIAFLVSSMAAAACVGFGAALPATIGAAMVTGIPTFMLLRFRARRQQQHLSSGSNGWDDAATIVDVIETITDLAD